MTVWPQEMMNNVEIDSSLRFTRAGAAAAFQSERGEHELCILGQSETLESDGFWARFENNWVVQLGARRFMRGYGQVWTRSTEQTATAGWRRHSSSTSREIHKGTWMIHPLVGGTSRATTLLPVATLHVSGLQHSTEYVHYSDSSTLRLANPSLLFLWIPIADTTSPKHSPDRRRWCIASASYKDGAPASCHQQSFQLRPSA